MMILRRMKCLKCGHKFFKTAGGFINRPTPSICPECGSVLTIPWI